MKISWQWLCEFLPPDHGTRPNDVREVLTAQGLEVEGLRESGDVDARVVVARVLEKRPHPGADRLSLCTVSTGKESFHVVCGAKNVAAGGVYPFATLDAVLPSGLIIKRSKIRGEESEGMLCSEIELGLEASQEGLLELPADSPLGLPVRDLPGIRDTIFEINVTPNRGDCLSHLGIARELYAHFLHWDFSRFERMVAISLQNGTWKPMAVDSQTDRASLYLGRAIKGVSSKSSPFVARRRLLACGIRPINSIVDATNTVLLERGHPVHAFDLKKLHGAKISVRSASAAESLVTLDEVKRTLTPEDLVVCDASGPVALAGLMGGCESRVSDDTSEIFLECAVFDPVCIRATCKRLGLVSESSYRFERGVDRRAARAALARLTDLIVGWSGGSGIDVGAVVAAGSEDAGRQRVELSWARAERFLGMPLAHERCVESLRRLGFGCEGDGDLVGVLVPSHRPDIEGFADIVEELARMAGYASLPARLPHFPPQKNPLSSRYALLVRLRAVLNAHGFNETVHAAFFDKDVREDNKTIVLANPLSERESQLRQTLVGQLLATHAKGERERSCRLFETGTVFSRQATQVQESPRLALLVDSGLTASWDSTAAARDTFDFFACKGLVYSLFDALRVPSATLAVQSPQTKPWKDFFHPGKGAAIVSLDSKGDFKKREIGWFGELHPREAKAYKLKRVPWLVELDLDRLLQAAELHPSYRPLSPFPGTSRDLTLVVDEAMSYQELADFFERERKQTPLLEAIAFVALYCGDSLGVGKKSMSFRFSYGSRQRTLTDEEVNASYFDLINKVTHEKKVEIR